MLLSDSTLEFIARGWQSSTYAFNSVYAESLILELERLSQVKSLECSALILMPSLDSFSLGILNLFSWKSNELYSVAEQFLAELLIRVKKLKVSHPSIKIIFISPFRISAVSQLADSQKSELEIAETFAKTKW